MVKILDRIFSKEVPVSLEEQTEIDRRVELFKLFFYEKLSVLEQQPPGKRDKLVKSFFDEIEIFLEKNAFAVPVENYPKNSLERKMWKISDKYYEKIAEVIKPQAERYRFYEDSFWKKFGNDLFFVSPTRGVII